MASDQRPIVDTILGDIAALVPQFSSIVASYRLLVGAAEELRRTKGACEDVIDRAIMRADRTGTLIDMFLEILCCKVSFSTNFLAVSCAPVDIFRLLALTCTSDPSRLTAEQIIELEALRQLLCRERTDRCFADNQAPCAAPSPPETAISPEVPSDIAEELETEVIQELSSIVSPKVIPLS